MATAAAAEDMAVRFESFSIREYTTKMRSIDSGKCWPFHRDARERKLPPIASRKYRWWSTELEIARSACPCPEGNLDAAGHSEVEVFDSSAACFEPEKVEINEEEVDPSASRPDEESTAGSVLPVDRRTDCSLADVAIEERRETKCDGKARMRTPKKRSIVELFAVAPQIETIEEELDESDGDEEHEEEQEEEVIEKVDSFKEVVDGEGEDALAPRKRKEELVEILMRKKNQKKKLINDKTKKKMKKKRIKEKQHKRKSTKLGICVAKKEKILKLNLPSQVDCSRYLQELIFKNCSMNEISQPVGIRRKNHTVKGLPKKNKLDVLQTTKLVSKQQKKDPTVLPIHSILKNRTRVTSVEDDLLGSLSKLHRAQQSEKRVSFSGKDDILGHKNKHCSPKDLHQIQSLCKAFSDALSASLLDKTANVDKQSHVTDESQVVIENEIDAVSLVDERSDQSSREEKQFIDSYGHAIPPMFISPHKSRSMEKSTLGESVDLNHDLHISSSSSWFDSSSSNPLLNQSCSGNINELNSNLNQGFESDTGKHAGDGVPSDLDSGRNMPVSVANCVSRSIAMNPWTATTRNSGLPASASCLAVNMEPKKTQSCPLREPPEDVCSHVSQLQPFSHFYPKELSSIYPPVRCKKQLSQKNVKFGESILRANHAAICEDRFISEDFIGLPLNSQGELIHTNANGVHDQLFKKKNAVLNSVQNFPTQNLNEPKGSMAHPCRRDKIPRSVVHPKDQSKWLPEHHNLKNYSANTSLLAGSGFTAVEAVGQTEIQGQEFVREYDPYVSHSVSEQNAMRVSCHGCKDLKQPHNHTDRENIQIERNLDPCCHPTILPTMRLMGKTLTVGRSNKDCQGFDDGKIWTDKEIIKEHSSTLSTSDKSISKDWSQQEWAAHLASGTSKGKLSYPVENQISSNMRNFNEMTAFDPKFQHGHINCGPCWMSRNSNSSSSGNLGSRFDSFSHPLVPHPLLNKTSMNPENYTSATESCRMCCQPVEGSNPYSACQHMLLNSTNCRHTQNLSYSMTSTYPPPLLNCDGGKYVQQPLVQYTPQKMPQWMLNAKQKKNTNSSCLSYEESISKIHPCTMSAKQSSPVPSTYPTSFISYPVYISNAPQTCLPNLPSPDSFVHSSYIPAFPGIKSTSVSNTSFQNKCKNKDGMKSYYTWLKGSDHAKKSKKRPASKDDEVMKRMKKPNLRILDDSNALVGYEKEQVDGCIKYTAGAPELDAYLNTDMNGFVKAGFTDTSGASFLKECGGSRSGPVKLSAGAKHILKPSQNIDPDNSKPTHSTIPFVLGTSGKLPKFHRKSAKIYQF